MYGLICWGVEYMQSLQADFQRHNLPVINVACIHYLISEQTDFER